MKAAKKRGQLEVTPVPFLNPDPIVHLVGCSNEALVIVDGWETATLIDLGAQISSVSAKFYKDLALQIKPLGCLLELEGTEGAAIPFLRFVEVNLQILGIRNYNEDVVLLVIPTTTYSETVSGCGWFQNNWQGAESNAYMGTCKDDHDMVTGSFWSSHVGVAATIP